MTYQTTQSRQEPTYGTLMDYTTGCPIRPATRSERDESDSEVAAGHPEGMIVIDGRTCWVE